MLSLTTQTCLIQVMNYPCRKSVCVFKYIYFVTVRRRKVTIPDNTTILYFLFLHDVTG